MRHDYEMMDPVTFYFVTYQEPDFCEPSIRGWTDDKVLLDFYLEFHSKKGYKVKVINDTYKAVVTLINKTCRNDEITLVNTITVKRDKVTGEKLGGPLGKRLITVSIPMTTAEMNHVSDNAKDFCSSIVDYSQLNELVPLLKKKYTDALESLGLSDIILSSIHNRQTDLIRNMAIDELMILLKCFPAEFE